tara:strand:+ start:887 stop:1009 length:123 start_codon:yes stop_codon:yes gene_type:complete
MINSNPISMKDLPVATNSKKKDIKGGLSVDADGKVTNVKR